MLEYGSLGGTFTRTSVMRCCSSTRGIPLDIDHVMQHAYHQRRKCERAESDAPRTCWTGSHSACKCRQAHLRELVDALGYAKSASYRGNTGGKGPHMTQEAHKSNISPKRISPSSSFAWDTHQSHEASKAEEQEEGLGRLGWSYGGSPAAPSRV